MEKNIMDHISDSDEVDQKNPVGDRISELPNDVIELILSKLKLRDAVRTGFLNHRWKHMWEYRTSTLDLDFDLEFNPETDRGDKAEYIRAVNKILNAHKGSTIEEFKVTYDLDVRHKFDIDSWIIFALRKKVRSLDLNFTQIDSNDFKGPYVFPLLKTSNLSCLISLSLQCVKFTDAVLNYLLLNCPFLESLCVRNVSSRKGVCLVECPKLKHLEIGVWSFVLEISSAPNLTSFIYTGSSETKLLVENVPNLTHVSLGGSFCRPIVQEGKLPAFIFQLKKLTLELRAVMMFHHFDEFPKLNNVNELKLTCFDSDNRDAEIRDIFSCASVLNACPNLYKLSVRFNEVFMVDEEADKRIKWSVNKCLKVVEFEVFRGEEVELEFYECLLKSAPSLEKIIVDISEIYDDKRKSEVDEDVKWYTQQLSPSAELVMKS